MEVGKDRFLVVGLGVTGIETSKFLLSKGASVKAADAREESELGAAAENLARKGVEIRCGGHAPELFDWADTIVMSPGVRFNLPEMAKAREAGKKTVSEIELAWHFVSRPIIGVTGTNGKTTTTTMISEMFGRGGVKVFTGANIGTPLVSVAGRDEEYDFLLLELSSFQLQGTERFRPRVAAILNVSPNHLDHHEDMEEYTGAKLRLFRNQTEEDWAVFNAADPVAGDASKGFRAKKVSFSSGGEQTDVRCEGDEIVFGRARFSLRDSNLEGRHNRENMMAAVAVATVAGCPEDAVRRTVSEFRPLPHRMEYVLTVGGVRVYNDSKATSPFATLSAIESLAGPVVLVAGGKDKGTGYDVLKGAVREKVKALVLTGETKEKMRAALGGLAPTECADCLEEAVASALGMSEPGDQLLFSPGCSSFDAFSSYEERGETFKEIVRNVRS